ncbi:hypothetical protein K435DRAFT_836602 [Dendrothele bispora CBS 962.96]|uniref:CoA-dependent acyltransferase n=1 Tax=Dendrothele bispora (strain CBS 962.96) TaxID=1314807 RepID=A0A4S8MH52_DENBC|nr:hypothetical protein K435DRAFT_836602 [Dendrothele bispora CBS 962.96]
MSRIKTSISTPSGSKTSGLHFTLASDGSQYIRQLQGWERIFACWSAFGNGFSQIVFAFDVHFNIPLPEEQLRVFIQAAWIKLRFHAPWIACCSFSPDDGVPNTFYLSYSISSKGKKDGESGPQASEIVEAWAQETIVWRHEKLSFRHWQAKIKETYWHPGSGHFGVELHIAKGQSDSNWFIMFCCCHALTDGRGLGPIADLFFKFLHTEIEDHSPTTHRDLLWGTEIDRLASTAVVVMPPPSRTLTMKNMMTNKLKFIRPPFPNRSRFLGGEETELSAIIQLPHQQTQSLMNNCRAHKVKLTTVIVSIFVLADVAAILHFGKERLSQSQFAEMRHNYEKSEVYEAMSNAIDMRSRAHPRYNTSGGVISFRSPSYHDMSAIRKCIQIENKTIIGRNDPHAFWNYVVTDTHQVLANIDRQSSNTFHLTSTHCEALSSSFTQLSDPGIRFSSLGSLKKLGFFIPFTPANRSCRSCLTITDTIAGMRMGDSQSIAVQFWEYNDSLMVNLQSSRRWQNPEAWDTLHTIFRQLLTEIALDQWPDVPRVLGESSNCSAKL